MRRINAHRRMDTVGTDGVSGHIVSEHEHEVTI